jgi:general secretion pathway protein C
MPINAQSIWWPRLATFFLSLLAAATVVYWGLKLAGSSGAGGPMPAQAALPGPLVDSGAVARILGGGQQAVVATPVASASSRFALSGLIADGQHLGGALIAVDGKPPKPYRVGAKVDGSLVLQSVTPRTATLAPDVDAPATLTLELPLRKP